MSDETKHTAGPWEFKDGMQLAIGPIQDPEGQAVCIITGHAGQAFANAELIASAPRLKAERDALLAEIKKYVDAVEDLGLECPHGILADLPEDDVRNLEMAHDSLQAVIAKCGR